MPSLRRILRRGTLVAARVPSRCAHFHNVHRAPTCHQWVSPSFDQRLSHTPYVAMRHKLARICVFCSLLAVPVTFKQWRLQNRPQDSLCVLLGLALRSLRTKALTRWGSVRENKRYILGAARVFRSICQRTPPIHHGRQQMVWLARLQAHERAWLKIHSLAVLVLAQVRPLRSAGLVWIGAVCNG